MKTLTIRYYDFDKKETVEMTVPSDCVEIKIPPQPDHNLPALKVNVNTDAVIIDNDGGGRIAMWEFTEVYAEAVSDSNEEPFGGSHAPDCPYILAPAGECLCWRSDPEQNPDLDDDEEEETDDEE